MLLARWKTTDLDRKALRIVINHDLDGMLAKRMTSSVGGIKQRRAAAGPKLNGPQPAARVFRFTW